MVCLQKIMNVRKQTVHIRYSRLWSLICGLHCIFIIPLIHLRIVIFKELQVVVKVSFFVGNLVHLNTRDPMDCVASWVLTSLKQWCKYSISNLNKEVCWIFVCACRNYLLEGYFYLIVDLRNDLSLISYFMVPCKLTSYRVQSISLSLIYYMKGWKPN